MIRISAPLKPLPFKRVMTNGKRRYNSAEYTEFKKELGYFALRAMNGREPLKGEIFLRAEFYKKRPKNPASRNWGDLDNHVKAVMDSLNGICFVDDRQVVEIHATKQYGEPHIEIELEETNK